VTKGRGWQQHGLTASEPTNSTVCRIQPQGLRKRQPVSLLGRWGLDFLGSVTAVRIYLAVRQGLGTGIAYELVHR
jgi:hypothetical protein